MQWTRNPICRVVKVATFLRAARARQGCWVFSRNVSTSFRSFPLSLLFLARSWRNGRRTCPLSWLFDSPSRPCSTVDSQITGFFDGYMGTWCYTQSISTSDAIQHTAKILGDTMVIHGISIVFYRDGEPLTRKVQMFL